MIEWFRGILSRKDPAWDLYAKLEGLAVKAEAASPGARPPLFNRAGDLCADADERDAAKSYYGRAIDGYLEAEMYDAAAAVCRKLIRFAPDVVRARFTLAVLSIGQGQTADAEKELAEYVRATRKSSTQRYAIPRLQMVAEAVPEREVQRLIGRALLDLGETAGGEALLAAASAAPAVALVPTPAGERARWRRLLHVVTTDPQELWARHWIGLNVGRTSSRVRP